MDGGRNPHHSLILDPCSRSKGCVPVLQVERLRQRIHISVDEKHREFLLEQRGWVSTAALLMVKTV